MPLDMNAEDAKMVAEVNDTIDSAKSEAIKRLHEKNAILRDALEWLTEMSSYAVAHLERDWAQKNARDFSSALDQARGALERYPNELE